MNLIFRYTSVVFRVQVVTRIMGKPAETPVLKSGQELGHRHEGRIPSALGFEHQTDEKQAKASSQSLIRQRLTDFTCYTPHRCRYDPDNPPKFSTWLNILFAFAGCFTVANLYYTHPILNLLARDFKVTDQQASFIPTMAQAGYAVGLFLLNPPGDLLRRRPYILILVWLTATLWIVLCVTTSYKVFLALTFITGAVGANT